jgi:hypothetical protein
MASMSRRLLQIAVSIAAINAVLAGGIYILLGLEGINLTGGNLSIDGKDPAWATVDCLFRAIAGIWLVLGLMFAYLVPTIERQTAWFRFCCLAIFAMGIGRLCSILAWGTGSNPIFAMVLELAFPPLLIFWQSRIAQAAKP